MKHYAGIDVSLECSSVCVVDAEGGIVLEDKVLSEPEALIAWFAASGAPLERIGLEAGPLSQWLYAAMSKAGLAVELLETRHVRAAFRTMPVKTDVARRAGLRKAAVALARKLAVVLHRMLRDQTDFITHKAVGPMMTA